MFVNESEKMSILVYDVDTVIFNLRYQDVGLAVCGDAGWIEFGRTGVSKAEFAGRANHHYCMGVIVSQADI